MYRQLVSKEELQAWLTTELQKVEDCTECSIGGIKVLQQSDENGCNWSDNVIVSTGGVPEDYFRPYFEAIMTDARASFNIKGG